MSVQVLITGDYVSVPGWGRIPARGAAVRGAELWDEGKHVGTVCRPITYDVEPDGDSLRIYYTREGTS